MMKLTKFSLYMLLSTHYDRKTADHIADLLWHGVVNSHFFGVNGVCKKCGMSREYALNFYRICKR